MKDYLVQIVKYINALEQEAKQALQDITFVKEFKKGTFLLQQGEVCRSSFSIQKGLARKFYLNNEKEITTELFFADDIAVSMQSYTLQQPSHEFIQALENVTVSVMHHQAFQDVKRRYNSLLQVDLMMTEYYAMWLEQLLFRFHSMDAAARYQLLMKEQPHYIQHIPLTYLASYLGVSLETLSRIRARTL